MRKHKDISVRKLGGAQTTDFETIRRAMAVFNGFDGPSCDDMWWRTDGEYAPVTLLVSCSDLFVWGSADCERLAPSDLDDLEKAVADAKAAGDEYHGHLLWVARKRGMRPQGAYYEHFDGTLGDLFNACGPERQVGFGNPVPPSPMTSL
jgi:hypothetical protein